MEEETEGVYVVQPTDVAVTSVADRRWISVAARAFPALATTSKAKRERKASRLSLNGDARAATNTLAAVGDRITYTPPVSWHSNEEEQQESSKRHSPHEWLAVCARQGMRLVYENDGVAVIVKPVGIHVKGRGYRTVEYALQALLRYPPHTGTSGDTLTQPHAMHRLDYRVGGLLLVAKTRATEVALAGQFEKHQVIKRYRAILVGRLDPSATLGLATSPPTDFANNKLPAREKEDESQTYYYTSPLQGKQTCTALTVRAVTPSARYEWLTTVDLWPLTGRWHQLRLHTASLGHPVVGDDLHHCVDEGESAENSALPEVVRGSGLFLHAVEVSFIDDRGNRRSFEIPEPHKFDRFRHFCAINRQKKR